MDAVGKLAGGVAHDFNNLLAVISVSASLLAESLPDPSEAVRDELDAIAAAGERAASLTQQLLALGRSRPREPRALDLNAVVTGMGPMFERLIGERVSVSTELATPLGVIEADPRHLEQVLLNLVVNARDAVNGDGTVKIETGNVDLDGALAGVLGVRPGPHVMLAVIDSGCGMDAETRARVFEPFFTTKPVGEGTGLGLSTVFGIVQESGGAISVESEPGRGATFRVYFPRANDRVGEPSLPSAEAASEKGSETLLLFA
jgi:signal transduction histidine kinase